MLHLVDIVKKEGNGAMVPQIVGVDHNIKLFLSMRATRRQSPKNVIKQSKRQTGQIKILTPSKLFEAIAFGIATQANTNYP